MNREDIIRMAREAGFHAWYTQPEEHPDHVAIIERFAALVAAAEREKVAAWMIQRSYATGHGDTIEDLLVELEWQIREAEREACAKVCDDLERAKWESVKNITQNGGRLAFAGPMHCAAAIRARGQA